MLPIAAELGYSCYRNQWLFVCWSRPAVGFRNFSKAQPGQIATSLLTLFLLWKPSP